MTHPDISTLPYPYHYPRQESYSKSDHYVRDTNPSVKVESTDSPNLKVPPGTHFDYNHPRDIAFRFGSVSGSSSPSSFTFMPGQQWHLPDLSVSNQPFPIHQPVGVNFNLPSNPDQPISLNEDYEDGDDLGAGTTPRSAEKLSEKQVRRRSSKACDQCRKLKCKCERTGDGSLCRSCLTLNAKCTFLGPSRKRGPPKGYIDAIEVRLHQTEALFGVLLYLAGGAGGPGGQIRDSRAKSLIEDLSQDPLARVIINRVDNSPYGLKGRRGQDSSSSTGKPRGASRDQQGDGPGESLFHSTHPSHEWQDKVVSKMPEWAEIRIASQHVDNSSQNLSSGKSPSNALANLLTTDSESSGLSPRRLRRKICSHSDLRERLSPSRSPSSLLRSSHSPHAGLQPAFSVDSSGMSSPTHETDDGEREEQLEEAVGQLSLNEDEQVRFHGKASGLHLLGVKERIDGRNEGGIWRFPKARVWPPLPAGSSEPSKNEEDFAISMPDQNMQEHLMDLYWTYVHPALPIVHKQSFLEAYQRTHMTADSPYSGGSQTSSSSNSRFGSNHVSTVLLLAMFSIAARYSKVSAPLPPPGAMWTAGDSFFDSAKTILGSTYSTPRVGTCQALLLLGYREIGIGAMAQAWIYVGMAVRMAQDLGMHKSADKWQRVGGSMFTSSELQERRRIWSGCVIMDKYVSTYIGRPAAISERDFDTELPNEDEVEQTEEIRPQTTVNECDEMISEGRDVSGHCISCFNASTRLSIILNRVLQSIYAIRPDPSRTMELVHLEELLEKWHLGLPEQLRFDPMAKAAAPPPHILTLHMQYWCTVLLLHRPFIRHLSKTQVPSLKDTEFRAASRKSYDICVQAANKITAIVTSYIESYSIKQSSVFLCYYVFTASIMHVSTLTSFPDDPQARLGLNQCMDALKGIDLTWPSAGRAWELLIGSKVNLQGPNRSPPTFSRNGGEKLKRSADRSLSHEDLHDQRGYASSLNQAFLGQNPHGFSNVSLLPEASQTNNVPYYTGHERWGCASNDNLDTLSTSVLPQQYSTGFTDARGVSTARVRDLSGPRYSQYWNDYTVLGQLDPTYGVPVLSESASQQQHSDVFARPQEPPIYQSSSYSLYNSISPNS